MTEDSSGAAQRPAAGTPARKSTTRKTPATKAAATKSATKKSAGKKSAATKTAATKKAATKKTATKKTAATKKSATSKTATKKAATKKAATRKAATRKAATTRSAPTKAATTKAATTRSATTRTAATRTPRTERAERRAQRAPQSRFFAGAQKRARRMLDDPAALRSIADRANRSGSGRSGPFTEVLEDFRTLIRLVVAYARGHYREIPLDQLAVVVGGLIYVVSPLDLIPDAVPGVGFLDDAVVVGHVVKSVREELDAFRAWEQGSAGS